MRIIFDNGDSLAERETLGFDLFLSTGTSSLKSTYRSANKKAEGWFPTPQLLKIYLTIASTSLVAGS
jgi:hypothetical protein